MKKFLCYVMLLLIPTTAFAIQAQVDFTQTIIDHSGLILALLLTMAPLLFLFAKAILDRHKASLDEQTRKLEEKEDQAWKAELYIKEQEITSLKERVDRFESEHNACNRSLPATYVTRTEFDKFQTQHRDDFNGLTKRLEGLIRDLRLELKSDMQENINRVIDLIKGMK